MQPILDNTVNIISTTNDGYMFYKTCSLPFYSPDNTKVGFWSLYYNYWHNGMYYSSYHLYIKDLITNEITLVDTGNSDNVYPDYSRALFSPDSTKILFYSTSTNLIPADTELAANAPNTSGRWFIYDLVNGGGYVRAMYDVNYGNLEDYPEALWVDNEQIVVVSYASNLGGVHGFPEHKEVFLCNINSQTVTCLSTDPNLVDPYFISDSYNITSALDKVSFVNATLGQCIKIISTGELIVAQNLPGINNLGTITTYDRFSWDSLGNKFLFRLEYGPSNVTNHSTDDFIYNMLDDTIYPLNENNIDTIAEDSFSANPLFSPDGSKVAFLTSLGNIDLASTDETLNVYTKDLSTGILTKISKTILGGNILKDVLGYNWLSDNKIVFTTYSETSDEDNSVYDWFVHDIQLNTTKRINYAPNGDLIFSGHEIRRDMFNADCNTILFASILNYSDGSFSALSEYDDVYNIFAKVFEDKTLPFPPLGTTTVSPNDAINSTVTNTTSADIYRVADTITGIPTFSIIGSQYVERANSIRYRNDINSNIRWMSLTHPNLPFTEPDTIKIGAGIFKATSTLIDDIIDVKQNAATTTTNPVIGVLTTYTIDPNSIGGGGQH